MVETWVDLRLFLLRPLGSFCQPLHQFLWSIVSLDPVAVTAAYDEIRHGIDAAFAARDHVVETARVDWIFVTFHRNPAVYTAGTVPFNDLPHLKFGQIAFHHPRFS